MRVRPRTVEHRATTANRLTVAALVLSAIGLTAAGIARSNAQGAATEVAYVEALRGRVVASAQGAPTLLDVLDIISDRTRLDLQADSELRVCHYRAGKVIVMNGPLRASISASGVSAENGKAVDVTGQTCAAPLVSTIQGGFITRSVALATADVPLRPSIKVVNQGTKPIRKIVLWDGNQQTVLATFDRNMARPVLDEGRSYLLVVEQGDGGESKMLLQARARTQTGPLIVVIR